jgi:acyl-CoA hydrolase
VAAIDTDRVVTEHGVARLRAANVDARVRQMLAVADPQDRPALTEDARALGLI